MANPIYYPAAGATTTGYLKAEDSELVGGVNRPLSPRFFNKNEEAYYHHPFVLFSAAHHFSKFPNIRKELKIEDAVKVFVDSGGYQLATGVVSSKKYNSKIALDWSERNGDIFPILDHPVTPGCDPNERLKISKDAAIFYSENRSVAGKQILNVVSGGNVDASRYWYDEIKEIKLDGWAHGGHRGVLTPVIQTFLLLGSQGEFDSDITVPYHIFGVSSQVAMVYAAVMQLEAERLGWNVIISYDSSSFQKMLAYGGYMLFPHFAGLNVVRMSNRFDFTKLHPNAKLPCDCPVCEGVTDMEAFIKDPKQFYLLGALHNLAIVLRYKKAVDNMVSSGIDELIYESFPAAVSRNIKAIRSAFQDPVKGIDMLNHTFVHRDVTENSNSLEGFFHD